MRPLMDTGHSHLPAVVAMGVQILSSCSQVFGVSVHLQVGLQGHVADFHFFRNH